jgi:hypothetical protein
MKPYQVAGAGTFMSTRIDGSTLPPKHVQQSCSPVVLYARRSQSGSAPTEIHSLGPRSDRGFATPLKPTVRRGASRPIGVSLGDTACLHIRARAEIINVSGTSRNEACKLLGSCVPPAFKIIEIEPTPVVGPPYGSAKSDSHNPWHHDQKAARLHDSPDHCRTTFRVRLGRILWITCELRLPLVRDGTQAITSEHTINEFAGGAGDESRRTLSL